MPATGVTLKRDDASKSQPGNLFNMLRTGRHEVFQPPLQRRDAAEADKLVNLAQFCAQGRWSDQVTGLPAGGVVGLAKRTDHKCLRVERFVGQYAGMPDPIEDQVFIHFITDQVDIATFDQLCQLLKFGGADQRPLGLCGPLSIIIRVRGLSASVSFCQSMEKSRASSCTGTQRPPASSTEGS